MNALHKAATPCLGFGICCLWKKKKTAKTDGLINQTNEPSIENIWWLLMPPLLANILQGGCNLTHQKCNAKEAKKKKKEQNAKKKKIAKSAIPKEIKNKSSYCIKKA
jgi:hypothetical protein